MAETAQIKAAKRTSVGKGAARAARREGLVPAVIYGDKKPPESITLDYKTVWMQHNTGNFLSTVFEMDVDGAKTRVIPRDVQVDPVRDFPIHVDFLRLSKDARVNVEVSVNFINEELCEGLKRGGSLNVVRHTIELSCPADAIPESIEVDIEGLDIGDSFHASELTLPEGIILAITDRDFTIATIAAAVAEEVDEVDEELEGEEGVEAGEDAEEEEGGDDQENAD